MTEHANEVPKPYSEDELSDFNLTQIDAALREYVEGMEVGGLSFTLQTCRRIIATLRAEREAAYEREQAFADELRIQDEIRDL